VELVLRDAFFVENMVAEEYLGFFQGEGGQANQAFHFCRGLRALSVWFSLIDGHAKFLVPPSRFPVLDLASFAAILDQLASRAVRQFVF
jgi:hypothetical protein